MKPYQKKKKERPLSMQIIKPGFSILYVIFRFHPCKKAFNERELTWGFPFFDSDQTKN